MSKLISIITVNLNNLHGLKKTVESLVGQGSENFEWVFVDGVSADGSWEYVQEMANSGQFQFPIKLTSEKDSGIYDAMNKGIMRSEGEYILFLNSGDSFRTNYSLQKFEEEYELEKDLAFYSFAIELEGYGVQVTYPTELREEFFWNSSLCHQSTFIHKSVFENLGLYNTNYRIIADRYHFIEGIFKHGYRYKIINEFHLVIFNGDGISSTQYALRVAEIERMFTEIFGPFVVRNLIELGYYKSLEKNRLIWRGMLALIRWKSSIVVGVERVVQFFKKLIVGNSPQNRNAIQRGIVGLVQNFVKKKKIKIE